MYADYLLWYAKDRDRVKYRQIFVEKIEEGEVGRYRWIEHCESGEVRELNNTDENRLSEVLVNHRLLVHDNVTLFGGLRLTRQARLGGRERLTNLPKNSHWKTTPFGMQRLACTNRLMAIGDTLRFKRYLSDFSVSPVDVVWEDTAISGFGRKKQYVVETNSKVIERCSS